MSHSTRIAFITTVNHNVGDDFVRDGIISLLHGVIGAFEPLLIHKHLPITARSSFGWVHDSKLDAALSKIRPGLPLHLTSLVDNVLPLTRADKVLSSDILVQSGAPIFWLQGDHDSFDAEWWNPLLERRWSNMSPRIPFLNLAGGTCQPFGSDGSEVVGSAERLTKIRKLFTDATLTTVRDRLSQVIFEAADCPVDHLPCTSIFSPDLLPESEGGQEFVVFNYMESGGHFTLGQQIAGDQWEATFKSLLKEVSLDNRIVIACHNRKELALARHLFSDYETFYSDNYRDYLRLYRKASCGVVNRVHAGFALAGCGKPSIIVGSDTRAQMGADLNLPVEFVGKVTLEWLREKFSEIRNNTEAFSLFMKETKRISREKYVAHLAKALKNYLPKA